MGATSNQFLVFSLHADLYALPALDVTKVIEMGPLSPLPRLPACVLGITHHRGRITTLLDLAAIVVGKPLGAPLESRVLLLERPGRSVGLVCQAVQEMVLLDPATGTPPLRHGGLVSRIHVHRERAVHVLMTDALLGWVDKTCQLEVPSTSPRAVQPGATAGNQVPPL